MLKKGLQMGEKGLCKANFQQNYDFWGRIYVPGVEYRICCSSHVKIFTRRRNQDRQLL